MIPLGHECNLKITLFPLLALSLESHEIGHRLFTKKYYLLFRVSMIPVMNRVSMTVITSTTTRKTPTKKSLKFQQIVSIDNCINKAITRHYFNLVHLKTSYYLMHFHLTLLTILPQTHNNYHRSLSHSRYKLDNSQPSQFH